MTMNHLNDWYQCLENHFQSETWKNLKDFLAHEEDNGATIYPKKGDWFNALKFFAPKDTKVIIIGQDPYHGPKEAHGLAFSVQEGIQIPPSLLNIYKELKSEFSCAPTTTDLTFWAKQGVLLLNTALTVEKDKAASHSGRGWEDFTDELLKLSLKESKHCVVMLWGAKAQTKKKWVDETHHLLLASAHPSPLSAYRGFLGNNHFIKANEYLEANGLSAINWTGQ